MKTRAILLACLLTLALPARADPNLAEMAASCVLGTALSVVAQVATDNFCARTRHDLEVDIDRGGVGTASLDGMGFTVEIDDSHAIGVKWFVNRVGGAVGDVTEVTGRCSIDRTGLLVIGSTETTLHSDPFGSNFLNALDQAGALYYRKGVDYVKKNAEGFPRSYWDHRMTYERLSGTRGFVEIRHSQLGPEPTVCTIGLRGSVDISREGFELNHRIRVR